MGGNQIEKPTIDWWKIIWFPLAILKQAFVVWSAIKKCLTTVDRLLKWGYKGEVQCAFCRNCIESREHLFFKCGYSARIWKEGMGRCNLLDPPLDWDDVVTLGMHGWKKKTEG